MKLDLCLIAGIVNTDPFKYKSPYECHAVMKGYSLKDACMDIFCIAMSKVDSYKQSDLPKALAGYSVMFSKLNFQASFELIFSKLSMLRFFANGDAHTLPPKNTDPKVLISESCPKSDQDIAEICYTAFETFSPLSDRNEQQYLDEDARLDAFLTSRAKGRAAADRELTEWSKVVEARGDGREQCWCNGTETGGK